MQKLVIVTHPNIDHSLVNKTWVQALEQHPEQFKIHQLYLQYPDLEYDLVSEQNLLAQYDEIIFQFPIHWYSTPFALKKYIDEVFTYGWAFRPSSEMLNGKKIGFAVSAGGTKASYESSSALSVSTLLNDVQLSFQYCGCTITQIHALYGAMGSLTEERIAQNAQTYIRTFSA